MDDDGEDDVVEETQWQLAKGIPNTRELLLQKVKRLGLKTVDAFSQMSWKEKCAVIGRDPNASLVVNQNLELGTRTVDEQDLYTAAYMCWGPFELRSDRTKEQIAFLVISGAINVDRFGGKLELVHENGPGRVAVVLRKSQFVMVVTEAKKGDMMEGLQQNMVELWVAYWTNRSHGVTCAACPPLFGVVTNGYLWQFVRYQPTPPATAAGPSAAADPFAVSPLFVMELKDNSVTGWMTAIKPLMEQIGWMLDTQETACAQMEYETA